LLFCAMGSSLKVWPFCRILYLFVVTLVVSVCNRTDVRNTRIAFRIHGGYRHKAYLQTVPLAGEKRAVLDSVDITSGNDLVVFNVKAPEERPYEIKVTDSRLHVFFINDSPEISIEARLIRPNDFSVQHSPATSSVKNFLDNQTALAEQVRKEIARADSLKLVGAPTGMIDSLARKNDKLVANLSQQYINFADTVPSAGAFLCVYNNVDFGKNYPALKSFILRAAKRFPKSNYVQNLKEQTIDFIKIFEEEYNVGDYLPELVLPDKNEKNFSTYSLKGKYVFMDFWSTLCAECMKYDKEKVRAKQLFSRGKFEILSIALDPEKNNWKKYLQSKQYDWPQVIDQKVWNGETVRLYRIDSIPFNFLLDPHGKILSKAIKPDSVTTVLSRMIK
jgi:hypothetical protein